jgi:hypothetical protein
MIHEADRKLHLCRAVLVSPSDLFATHARCSGCKILRMSPTLFTRRRKNGDKQVQGIWLKLFGLMDQKHGKIVLLLLL